MSVLSSQSFCDEEEFFEQEHIVVGGEAVVALEAAAEAAMDEHRLAVGPCEARDGDHLRIAVARAVAGAATVHMARTEAERAVIAVLTAADRWPDEGAAMDTFERLAPLPHRAGRASSGGVPWYVAWRTNRHARVALLAVLRRWQGISALIFFEVFVPLHKHMIPDSHSTACLFPAPLELLEGENRALEAAIGDLIEVVRRQARRVHINDLRRDRREGGAEVDIGLEH